MTSLDTIRDLFDHMEWADAEVWRAASVVPAALEDARLRGLLHHLHVVQRAFLRIWRGESVDDLFTPMDDARVLRAWAQPYYDEAMLHLNALNEDRLREPIVFPWSAMVEQRLGRPPASTSLGESAMQVALHSAYHRGQINARFRELGAEPPLVDYIAWVWEGRPAAKWR